MNPRAIVFSLLSAALAASCATQAPPMYVPTEEEQRACEEQGGSIEPAFVLNAYVCLLPASQPAP